ncbi:hypothetical protein C943_01439 [Mariniradius saccharolyticus AK6]|uniref:Nucleoside 2-deoxyribosyltransferase n=1 Tax=Mariniradius saccharolyticus AK6 TaxID=1239962 RepID=M7XUK5_9BACT|nr:hypothetical protein [Mariniradius saccharolyticus]EMS32177.1 hypothetical protein C943_01439 [Mariniradius saccharolyticus AK6]
MEKCFVIQPFDKGKFDKRFVDIFEPAILNAGFEAYRIDKDLSVRIPIDDIEKGISESAICFAEITTDNPNVWYELGFAFACNKDVVMVCSDERQGKFPFDIQHRHVITYNTGSTSDFITLGDTITRKIKAFQTKSKTVRQLNATPVIETEGLKGHEIALLILIMENQVSSEDSTSIFGLRNEMNKAGYTDIATSVGIRTLSKNGMIETFKEIEHWNNGQEYIACRLTQKGEDWILSNQDQLQFRRTNNTQTKIEDDELPF